MSFIGKIFLTNNKDSFFSGDTIEGSVQLHNYEAAFTGDISIKLESLTCIKWEDLDQKSKHGEIIYFMQNFEGREQSVKQQICVQRNVYLPAGQHEYNFCLRIPKDVPSSLATTTGYIRYELVLVQNKSGTFNKLQQQEIRIQKHLNVAQQPKQLLPFTAHQRNNFCWWPCKSGPLVTHVTLSSSAFIPGEVIKYSIHIENQTQSCDAQRVSAFVIQTMHYKSLKPKQRTKTELNTLNYRNHLNSCLRNSKIFIENTFQLPLNLVASSEDDSLILVRYRFQVLIIMKGLHQDVSLIIPIQIGSHRTGATGIVSNEETPILIEDYPLSSDGTTIGDIGTYPRAAIYNTPIETVV